MFKDFIKKIDEENCKLIIDLLNIKKRISLADFVFILFVVALSSLLIMKSRYIMQLSGDLADAEYSVFSGISLAISKGELPLWSPYLWAGYSNITYPVSQIFYPITLLLCKLMFDSSTQTLPFMIIPVIQIIHIVIFCVSLYGLLRTVNFKRITCMIMSVLCTFSFATLFGIVWVHFLSCMAWLPLILMLSILWMKSSSSKSWMYCIGTGLAFGMSGLANPAQGLLLNILMFCFLLAFNMWNYKNDFPRIKELVFKTMLSAIIGVGICGISLFPVIEGARETTRFLSDGTTVEGMVKMSFANFTEHTVSNQELGTLIMGSDIVGKISLGIVVTMFFIMGVFIREKKEKAVFNFSLFTFMFCLLYSLGFVFTDIFYYIPFYSSIREPFLYAPYISLFACIIGAYGLDGVLCNIDGKMSLKRLKDLYYNLPGMVLILAIAIGMASMPHNIQHNKGIIIVLLVIFIVYWLTIENEGVKKRKIHLCVLSSILTAAIMLQIIDFKNVFSYGNYTSREATERVNNVAATTKELIAQLAQTDDNPYRIGSWGDQAYPSNIGSIIGFYDITGYINPIYRKTFHIHSQLNLAKKAALQNIKYYMHSDQANEEFQKWMDSAFTSFERVNTTKRNYSSYEDLDSKGINIYKTNCDLGVGWLVYDVVSYTTQDDKDYLIRKLNDEQFDLSSTALVNMDTIENRGITVQGKGQISNVELLEYKCNTIRFDVSTDKPAVLVTAESDYPGWSTYVNGKKVKTAEVNYANKGVILDAGESEVEFKYQPISLLIGLYALGLSIVISVVTVILSMKKSKIGDK